ncbi:hypothetical protein QSF53_005075, partial [Escherichia coli]
ERTTSSDCNPTGGVSFGVKNDRSGHRAPLTQRKNSRFRAVNMLTGCPGIFAVFIFIIQFVAWKKC